MYLNLSQTDNYCEQAISFEDILLLEILYPDVNDWRMMQCISFWQGSDWVTTLNKES